MEVDLMNAMLLPLAFLAFLLLLGSGQLQTISITNVTGEASYQCEGTDKASGITFSNGTISLQCSEDMSSSSSSFSKFNGPWLYNISTQGYFNDTYANQTYDTRYKKLSEMIVPWSNITDYPGANNISWSNISFPGISGLTLENNVTWTGVTGLTLGTNVTWTGLTNLGDNNITALSWNKITGFNGITSLNDNNITSLSWTKLTSIPTNLVYSNSTGHIYTANVNWANITNYPGASGLVLGTNITWTGITNLGDNNITSLSWSKLTNIPTTLVYSNSSNFISTANLSLKNLTGSTSQQCPGTDKVKNVTLTNGQLSITCETDYTGSGGSSSSPTIAAKTKLTSPGNITLSPNANYSFCTLQAFITQPTASSTLAIRFNDDLSTTYSTTRITTTTSTNSVSLNHTLLEATASITNRTLTMNIFIMNSTNPKRISGDFRLIQLSPLQSSNNIQISGGFNYLNSSSSFYLSKITIFSTSGLLNTNSSAILYCTNSI